MGRRLRSFVHVHDEHGRTHVFGPGDDVPVWAAERITNPKAWDGDEEPAAPAGPEESPADDADSEPPRSGAGSGKAVWAEYAAKRGIDVPDGASREDIIAAVDAANEQ